MPHPDAQTAFDGQIAVTQEAIWVADARGSYLVRVDVATNQITDVPIDPSVLAAGDAGLWMISPFDVAPQPLTVSLSQVDLTTGRPRLMATIPSAGRLAVGLGGVWVADGELRLLDVTTRKVLRHFAYDGVGIQVACGALWSWATATDEQHPWLLQQLDPSDGRVVVQVSLPALDRLKLDEIDGLCWTTNGAALLGIQPGQGLALTTTTASAVQIAGTTVWGWTPDGLVQRIDPRTGHAAGPTWRLPAQDLRTNAKGAPDWRLLSAGGSLWLLAGDEIVRYEVPTGE